MVTSFNLENKNIHFDFYSSLFLNLDIYRCAEMVTSIKNLLINWKLYEYRCLRGVIKAGSTCTLSVLVIYCCDLNDNIKIQNTKRPTPSLFFSIKNLKLPDPDNGRKKFPFSRWASRQVSLYEITFDKLFIPPGRRKSTPVEIFSSTRSIPYE